MAIKSAGFPLTANSKVYDAAVKWKMDRETRVNQYIVLGKDDMECINEVVAIAKNVIDDSKLSRFKAIAKDFLGYHQPNQDSGGAK
jgi:hypothetical protein